MVQQTVNERSGKCLFELSGKNAIIIMDDADIKLAVRYVSLLLLVLLDSTAQHVVLAIVERAVIKALEKQYNDILTPLKDSIPKKLDFYVQKLTRRQSTTLYSVTNQILMEDNHEEMYQIPTIMGKF
ncbi:hypothetical protein GIB67_041727 [Kingdonia uniflora]|uniref:Uncharacterized protein n=1 Tax=Kingdonia uniflora TaxID=39325 RepID=A0A7J7NP03_9MAGN|nr:hypothetical protein GIB67_041727 [Kingdonia uniflora]